MAFSMKGSGGPRSPRPNPAHPDGSGGDWQPGKNQGDDAFKRMMADLSTRLAERSSPRQPGDFEPADGDDGGGPRGPTLRLLLGFTLGATAAIAGLAAFHSTTQRAALPHEPAAASAMQAAHDMSAVVPPPPATPRPPSDAEIASINTNPPPGDGDAATAGKTEPQPASPPHGAAAAAEPARPAGAGLRGSDAGDSAAATDQTPLARYEIMEVQTRLQWLGFSPGGLDGVSGHLTAAAVRRYEAAKGLPQSGTIDQSLLNRLRQDSPGSPKP